MTEENLMRIPRVHKVVVHIGVGESGTKLTNAMKVLEMITGQKPTRTFAKKTRPAFGIKKGEPIGCKVTLRKKRADEFLKNALGLINYTLYEDQFDDTGNFSFGIVEHLGFPNIKYDPAIGIFGMDVIVSIERPGIRVKERRIKQGTIPRSHRVNKDEAINFAKDQLGIKVI
ncbi:MAG: 50S ribosomal protein L5 [Candidatus Methanoliparum thermophilum]|uniref:Large ribosomal subunit protein uL5 n=1 Tax=Methanoliparum thermophilum TaxID=2491083 RepID=A0A520KTW0_METT2|nr:MAG: 50S ribosomal protein L5 [Candidatus Methanoliparum thermophilum]